MKATKLFAAVAVVAAMGLTGCDQIKKLAGGGKAKGQVVATVDGEEITNLELRAELGNFGSRDPAVMKAAQQQALQRIIMRRLLAQKAKDEKLDKTTDFTLQMKRGEETLLAQLYQRKLAAKLAQPSRTEAEAFVSSHPEMFANRRVLFVDQVIAAPSKITPDRLRPLKTLGEVKALLDSEGVQYQENAAVLDTLSADPRLVAGINNLPPGEIFVIPQGGALLFNQVSSSRSAPLTGTVANAYAMNALRGQKAQQSVGKQLADLRKAAEPKITYNPAFKPPPEKKAAPAAKAPAAAAPAAAPAAAAPATPEAK
ncbi:MAG: EpsD family peptidyl-prolyl cis-trans isomerase [Phenylobacterium sp.]|uniref:EpsD family peptidyl-prolyl cis-trans isomerase n=1 Tax=Phenylobacterium sp. TaxID=1871053 RepID=UPI001A379D49|nr:EpsD family peptidyl-prolyl cis-trans isomerase [Phenylobacterium sp.]MBL8554527.1 EpsD family peptidyl-prolyl cis-trans isomerase [Phenylobacterium sp.]